MNAAAPPGWPFLVARGRRRGYSTLLAPRDLVAERDYGVLEDAVGPVDGLRFRVGSATTARGRRLSLVWAEYAVTTADLASTAGASAGSGAAAGARPVRDEHSRPLRLLYGFACAPATVTGPVEADLARCREAALGAYRRFLADEDAFTVEGSTPFRLASAVTEVSEVSTPQPAAAGWRAAAGAPRAAPPTVRRHPAALAPAAGRGMAVQAAAIAFGVLVAVVAAGVVWLHNSPASGPPACPTAPASQAPTPGGRPGNPTGGPSPGGAPPKDHTPGGSPPARPTGPTAAGPTGPTAAGPTGPGNAGGPAPTGPGNAGGPAPAAGPTASGKPGDPAPASAPGTPVPPNPPASGPATPGQVPCATM